MYKLSFLIILLLFSLSYSAVVFYVNLAWDAPVSNNMDGYTVYRKGRHTLFELIASTEVETYIDTVAKGFYCYVVTAYNTFGESLPSNQLCLNIPKDVR